MSLCGAGSAVTPPPPEADAVVTNDGFFPAIDPAMVRASMRETGITVARLKLAIVGAIITAARDLAAWKLMRIADGHDTLAAVPAEQIAGRSILVQTYERAIVALARAELIERHPDTDQAKRGRDRDDVLETTVGELRRDATHAIRDMLGVGRTCVELI